MNGSGVYDFCFIPSESKSTPMHMDYMRRQIRPYVMQNLSKSSYVVRTNVNANVVVESRTWYVSPSTSALKYDQEIANACGSSIAFQIADRLALDNNFKIKADRGPTGLLLNNDLRLLVNYVDKLENLPYGHQHLSAKVQDFLKKPNFYIDVIASVMNLICLGYVQPSSFENTIYYFESVVKCKRLVSDTRSSKTDTVQDVYIMPTKLIDLSNDEIAQKISGRMHASADGTSYSVISIDPSIDVTDQVLQALKNETSST